MIKSVWKSFASYRMYCGENMRRFHLTFSPSKRLPSDRAFQFICINFKRAWIGIDNREFNWKRSQEKRKKHPISSSRHCNRNKTQLFHRYPREETIYILSFDCVSRIALASTMLERSSANLRRRWSTPWKFNQRKTQSFKTEQAFTDHFISTLPTLLLSYFLLWNFYF